MFAAVGQFSHLVRRQGGVRRPSPRSASCQTNCVILNAAQLAFVAIRLVHIQGVGAAAVDCLQRRGELIIDRAGVDGGVA